MVDNRYSGNHGIARYAREVLSRISLDWLPLESWNRPIPPGDLINLRRLRLTADVLLYSPGYSVGPTRAVQVPTVHDLIHLHGPQGRRTQLYRQYYERVLRPTIERAGHVITVSRTSADDLNEWLGDAQITVHNLGNGCSSAFERAGQTWERARPYLTYVGNLKSHKNPRIVFASLKQLPDLDLVVVTSDSVAAATLAREYGVSDQVTILRGVDDARLAAIYRGSVCHLIPSLIEGFGLPALEALKCGTPVIYYSECASVREICMDGQFPIHEPTRVDEMVAQVRSAMDCAEVSLPLGRYSWDAVGAGVDSLLARLVADA